MNDLISYFWSQTATKWESVGAQVVSTDTITSRTNTIIITILIINANNNITSCYRIPPLSSTICSWDTTLHHNIYIVFLIDFWLPPTEYVCSLDNRGGKLLQNGVTAFPAYFALWLSLGVVEEIVIVDQRHLTSNSWIMSCMRLLRFIPN